MFETEVEEWADEMYPCDGQAQRYLIEGAEFGYNKANEWQYPSKGEYPKDEFVDEYRKSRLPSAYKRHYCLYLGGDDCVIGKYMRGLFWTVEGQYSLSEIIAWKEIVLPKESE